MFASHRDVTSGHVITVRATDAQVSAVRLQSFYVFMSFKLRRGILYALSTLSTNRLVSIVLVGYGQVTPLVARGIEGHEEA